MSIYHNNDSGPAGGVLPNVPIVALIGLTGSGKSYLIAQVTGDASIIGASIESCTTAVTPYMAEVNGKKVILLDTPGFNDTHRSDAAILNLIADWVEATYKKKIPLSGVIYMHDISQERMTGSAVASIKIFRELCGEDFYKNIVFVSNMWHKTTEEAGHAKLAEVMDKFWGLMMKRGSAAVDFKGGMTAESIVTLTMNKVPAFTKLGRELVDERKPLLSTNAGMIASEMMLQTRKEHERLLTEMSREMEIAIIRKDKDIEELARQEAAAAQAEIKRLNKEVTELSKRCNKQSNPWDMWCGTTWGSEPEVVLFSQHHPQSKHNLRTRKLTPAPNNHQTGYSRDWVHINVKTVPRGGQLEQNFYATAFDAGNIPNRHDDSTDSEIEFSRVDGTALPSASDCGGRDVTVCGKEILFSKGEQLCVQNNTLQSPNICLTEYSTTESLHPVKHAAVSSTTTDGPPFEHCAIGFGGSSGTICFDEIKFSDGDGATLPVVSHCGSAGWSESAQSGSVESNSIESAMSLSSFQQK